MKYWTRTLFVRTASASPGPLNTSGFGELKQTLTNSGMARTVVDKGEFTSGFLIDSCLSGHWTLVDG